MGWLGLLVYSFGSAPLLRRLGLLWTRSSLLYILLRSRCALMAGVPFFFDAVELCDDLDIHIRTICVQIYIKIKIHSLQDLFHLKYMLIITSIQSPEVAFS